MLAKRNTNKKKEKKITMYFLGHLNATSSLTNAETAFLCGNEIHFRDGGQSENLRGEV